MIKEFIESLIIDKHSEESIILAEQYQSVYESLKESNSLKVYPKYTDNIKSTNRWCLYNSNTNKPIEDQKVNFRTVELVTPYFKTKEECLNYASKKGYTVRDNTLKESNEVILENEQIGNELVEEINNIYKKINYLQENTYYKESNFLNAMFNSYSDRLRICLENLPFKIEENNVKERTIELEKLVEEIADYKKTEIFLNIAKSFSELYITPNNRFTTEFPTKTLLLCKKIVDTAIIKVSMLSTVLKTRIGKDILEEGVIRDVVRTVSFKRWRNINKMNKNDYSGFMEDLEEDLDDIDTLKDKERFINKIKDELEDAERIVASEDFTKLVLPEYRREFSNYVTFLKRLKSKAEIKKVEK